MAKTTFVGWSLEKHGDFVEQLQQRPRSRLIHQRKRRLFEELARVLPRERRDGMSNSHQEMVQAMSSDSGWYKCRERDVNFRRPTKRQIGGESK